MPCHGYPAIPAPTSPTLRPCPGPYTGGGGGGGMRLEAPKHSGTDKGQGIDGSDLIDRRLD